MVGCAVVRGGGGMGCKIIGPEVSDLGAPGVHRWKSLNVQF